MIFVNTDLETALTRNRNRKRTLPDDQVTTMWKEVQKNLGKFQNYFGANFTIVDNSEGVDTKAITLAAYKKISKWIKKSPSTRTAKNWISQEKSRRGINEAYETYLIKDLGWTKHKCPRKANGKKYLVRDYDHKQAIILTRGHLTAMIDGVVNDISDCGYSYHNKYYTQD